MNQLNRKNHLSQNFNLHPTNTCNQAVFYYDLASPEAYLVAERARSLFAVMPEWQPILASQLAQTEQPAELTAAEQARLAARASELGLQPLRWPKPWPPNSEFAMLVATYAKQIGRAVAFSLAAFRQAFAGGRDLSDPDTVLIAAAACELHPKAVQTNAQRPAIAQALAQATHQAQMLGVTSVPTIRVNKQLFVGDVELDAAAKNVRQCGY
jgi:2-hydroxychromene-2-carboxylate isomerase